MLVALYRMIPASGVDVSTMPVWCGCFSVLTASGGHSEQDVAEKNREYRGRGKGGSMHSVVGGGATGTKVWSERRTRGGIEMGIIVWMDKRVAVEVETGTGTGRW